MASTARKDDSCQLDRGVVHEQVKTAVTLRRLFCGRASGSCIHVLLFYFAMWVTDIVTKWQAWEGKRAKTHPVLIFGLSVTFVFAKKAGCKGITSAGQLSHNQTRVDERLERAPLLYQVLVVTQLVLRPDFPKGVLRAFLAACRAGLPASVPRRGEGPSLRVPRRHWPTRRVSEFSEATLPPTNMGLCKKAICKRKDSSYYNNLCTNPC